MKKYILSLVLLGFFSNSLFAYNVNIYSRNNVKEQSGEVIINNEIIMRLFDTIDRQDPFTRADELVQSLTRAVAFGVNPAEIKVKYIGGYYHAVIGNRQLFTVGKKEAVLNQTTEDILAIEWIEKIRRLLKGMPVSDVKMTDTEPVAAAPATAPVIAVSAVPETGMAAWFEGDNDDFVAVHPALPVGTKVRVKNNNNGWSIVVKIIGNKTLPVGRIVNVSKSAAQALGILQTGSGRVTITPVVF